MCVMTPKKETILRCNVDDCTLFGVKTLCNM